MPSNGTTYRILRWRELNPEAVTLPANLDAYPSYAEIRQALKGGWTMPALANENILVKTEPYTKAGKIYTLTFSNPNNFAVTVGIEGKSGSLNVPALSSAAWGSLFEYGEQVGWSATAGGATNSGTLTVTGSATQNIGTIVIPTHIVRFNNLLTDDQIDLTINMSEIIHIPAGQSSNVAVSHGQRIEWSASATGFVTETGSIASVTENQSVNLELDYVTYHLTFSNPNNFAVSVSISGESHSVPANQSTQFNADFHYGDSAAWSATAQGATVTGTHTVTGNNTVSVGTITPASYAITFKNMLQSEDMTVKIYEASALVQTLTLTAGGGTGVYNSQYGSSLNWTASASGYQDQSGSVLDIRSAQTVEISMTAVDKTLTFSNPNMFKVSVTVSGTTRQIPAATSVQSPGTLVWGTFAHGTSVAWSATGRGTTVTGTSVMTQNLTQSVGTITPASHNVTFNNQNSVQITVEYTLTDPVETDS